ncbi:TonB-linked SusC/RagA family outer membrane protein [Chitinophaga polysaccharea]|uniref:TonB-linked SusC/RagA family outer membrane protein n=1 Tax=Chitinophaga polysaccharea TaxID=1293035 RepID=A0A561PUE9_9BACT|nr:TonB-dependent receptor [Chitinophaga polysaccharea]TWF41736.1 TonB-linked SusC/RagA family outer membrane protein [Chitinophaga polysaccharea]
MKLSTAFLFVSIMHLGATAYSQVTLSVRNMPLGKVFTLIKAQTGREIFYSMDLLRQGENVTLQLNNAPLQRAMDEVLKGRGLTFEIIDKNIVITKQKAASPEVVQDQVISGKVTDEAGNPLPGASLKWKNTAQGANTDASGNFSLKVPNGGGTLVITFVGYESQEIAVAKGSNLKIALKASTSKLGDLVVIGYGTRKKALLTSSISTVKATEFESIPTGSLSNLLQGRLSGTYVQTSSGFPGQGSGIRVRINTSWNNSPLVYVIDGVVRDEQSFNALDPNEVEEVTVLKDAASAAIYGSRSSNGVLMVTTKKGKSGKPVVAVSSTVSTERYTQVPKYMEAGKSMDAIASVYNSVSPEEKDWLVKNNPDGMNLFRSVYRNPRDQRYTASLSGGSNDVTYFLGGSYYNQDGFLSKLNYNKYNLRGNVQVKSIKNLTVGLNVSTNTAIFNGYSFGQTSGNADQQEFYKNFMYMNPWVPANIDGKFPDIGWIGNPAALLAGPGYRKNRNQQVDALLNFEYKIPFVEGLSINGAFSKNYNNNFTKEFASKSLLYKFKMAGANSRIFTNEVIGTTLSYAPAEEFIANATSQSNSYQLNGQLNYQRSFGKHQVEANAIVEQYEYQSYAFNGNRRGFPLYPLDQFFAASGDSKYWGINGNEGQDGRVSYIGRINYNYDERFLFTASARRDGSIKFAPDRRWGTFPSVSAGWIISNESFFKNSADLSFVDFLKVRGNFAQTGNDAIGGWAWLEQYNISGDSYFEGTNGTSNPRLTYGGIPNPNLTWEKSNSVDVGFELGIFKSINLTADYWTRHTYDILGSRILAVPLEYGANLPSENYGIVNGHGADFELEYNTKLSHDFSLGIKANLGFAGNKVIKRDVAANAQDVDNPNGKSLSYQAGYRTTGILRSQGEVDKLPQGYTIFGAKPEPGMMNFQDISGPNGVPDGKIDNYDRVVLGSNFGPGGAKESFGLLLNLGWKNLHLEMLFSGLAGFKIVYNDPWGRQFADGNLTPIYHDNAWTPDNPNGTHPRLYSWGDARAQGYVQVSDFNTYPGSFIRMKNLNLSYSLTANTLKRIGLTGARVWASATNLFYLSKFKFYDPELYGFSAYPASKTYSLGLNINL